MKTFTSTSKQRPLDVIVGKSTVDVNTDIHEVEVPIHGVKHKAAYEPNELEVVYKYTTTRYSLREYITKTAEETALLKDAVAELADVVTGGN